jgi:TolB protein
MNRKIVLLFVSMYLFLFPTSHSYGNQVSKSGLSNTKIAYTLHEKNESSIHVMDFDGSHKVKLTKGVSPCWSPDGQKIAFAAEKNGNRDIYYMNADGTDITQLTRHPAEDVYPSWSPDGSMIAFNSERSGSSQIWRINVTDGDGKETWGYNLTQLTQDTPHKRVNNYHSWSPNGLWLAFEADRDRDDPEIYLANAVDGTNQQRLTFTRALDEVPSWSPDSKQILFSSDMHGEPQSRNYDIYIMNIDGSNLRRLTKTEGAASYPTMSPDGSKIAFDLSTEGNSDIYVIEKDGSNPVCLGKGSDPDWSPFVKNKRP